MIPTTVIGSFPVRLDGGKYADAYFGGKSADAAGEGQRQAVEAQVKAGVDIVSDGQTRGDFVSAFARKFSGVVMEGRPVVLKAIEYRGPSASAEMNAVRRLLPKNVKLKGIITGPYTLAKSSENRHYKDLESLAFAYAEGLAQEANELDKAADYVQVDEPFFSVDYPKYGRKLVETVFAGVKKPRMLHVCGDVSAVFAKLVRYDVDVLEHEFAANPSLWDAVRGRDFPQTLGVGVVRSDVNEAETVEEIEARMRTAREYRDAGKLMFNPDCGLRNLDPEVAQAKLRNMVQARDRLK
jgi:5-methyltetrahydropteroyltriglutamate--homocysteine methyltransferase